MADASALRILSADAPKIGLRECARLHAAESGLPFEIALQTAPRINERILTGAAGAEIVVLPLPLLEELAAKGWIDSHSIVSLGAVSVGVVVRNGAREPDLSSRETFMEAILVADAVIYNTASSGLYVARLLDKLGLASKIEPRTVVVATGAAVIDELLARPSADAIGFGHITEIRLHDARGTHLAGPLPECIGRNTVYAAGILAGAVQVDAARSLIKFMVSAAGKRIFAASGVTESKGVHRNNSVEAPKVTRPTRRAH
jgi:molybdate transport system substrate-binding protein